MSWLRIASWIVVACVLACALGLFVPAFELPVGGHVMSKRQTISLRQAAHDRELVRKLLAAYRTSKGGRYGTKVVSKVAPHAGGKLKGYLEDAGDAMDTLSGISDDDVRTYGLVFAAVVWGFLALDLAIAALAFVAVVRGSYRRGHLIAGVALGVVVLALAIGVLVGCKEVAFEANDELGASAITLGPAPYMIVAGAVGACGAAVAALVLHIRAGRGGTVGNSGRPAA